MKDPLISVIVPTLNSERFLEACLQSVREQTYEHIELIVVDNFSIDNTQKIAEEYADSYVQKGPERSAQVNYAVTKAAGDYVYKVDSDFTLDKDVVRQCVDKAAEGYEAIVVHNTPNHEVSWIAKLRKFEVDMYKYDHLHSSPRFVLKSAYMDVHGFNEDITAGEDYDFRNRLDAAGYKTGFIDAEALHHGEPTSFWSHMKKYYHYGKDIQSYADAEHNSFVNESGSFASVYIRNWKKLLSRPHTSLLLFAYTGCKAAFGASGWFVARLRSNSNA